MLEVKSVCLDTVGSEVKLFRGSYNAGNEVRLFGRSQAVQRVRRSVREKASELLEQIRIVWGSQTIGELFWGVRLLENCLGESDYWRIVWGSRTIGELFGGVRLLENCLGESDYWRIVWGSQTIGELCGGVGLLENCGGESE